MFLAFPINVNGAGDKAGRLHFEPPDTCAGDKPRASLDVLRPVRDIDRAFCALDATPHACGALGAWTQRTVTARRDGVRGRPPMPAELVVRPSDATAHGCQRRGR